MPIKKLIIIGACLLLVALVIWANMAESPTEGISGDPKGQPAWGEKDLPTEERIPTH